MKTVVVVIFCLFMGFLGFEAIRHSNDPQGGLKDWARSDIAACDKAHRDELLPLSERRAIRDQCDQMRRDYDAKFSN